MASVSAPSLGLSGLASGVDTSGIIQQLMAVDQQSLIPIQRKQAITTTHQSKLKALTSAVNALQSAAEALKDPATWQAKQTTSSTSSNVGVTLLSGAGIGGHTIQVDRLASSAQHGYSFTQGTSVGKFDIYYGSDPNAAGASKVTITVGANETAADVATAINANEKSPVYAAAVTDPATGAQRLVLSSRKTGGSGDFSVDSSAMTAGPLTEDVLYQRTGSAQHGFAFTPSPTTDQSFDLFYGSDPNAAGASKVTINVAAGATAADVAAQINADAGSPVSATTVTDRTTGEERLVFSSRRTGVSSDFTVDQAGMAASPMAEDSTYKRTGGLLNALYKVDGDTTDRESETNVTDNALPGLRVTFNGVTASPASITTTAASIDQSGVQKKVQAFVGAYNSLVDLANANLTEQSVRNPQSTADLVKGSLFGDIGLQSMLSQMHNQVMSKITGLGSYSSLADIGVGIPSASAGGPTDDAKEGKITLDTDKLTSALSTDWTQVRNLFSGVGATKGFTAVFDSFADKQVGTNGLLTQRQATDDTTLTGLQKQLDTRNQRLKAEQQRLTAQFTAMESALQQSQTQQAWLTSQIASL